MLTLRLLILAVSTALTLYVVIKAVRVLGGYKFRFQNSLDYGPPKKDQDEALIKGFIMLADVCIYLLWIGAIVLSFWMFLGATTISP